MEHLSLEIFDLTGTGSKYAMLPDDTSITITETSEIFASGDVWSHSFTLNVIANAHIFGTSGDIHGSRLHEQIHKRRARLWVEGVPLYLGYLTLGDEVDVDEEGNVDVSFESGQKTFDEMIEGAKANQVPMMGDVVFGMALWRQRRVKFNLNLYAVATLGNYWTILNTANVYDETGDDIFHFDVEGEEDGNAVQPYPRMVFPKGRFDSYVEGEESWDEDCINTDLPYSEDEDGTPTNPYCNVALCYQKQGYEKKNQNGMIYNDYSSEPEAMRGYEVMPANRVNSAPNFYVIYWLRCLMQHLGIHIEENQMLDVEDLRRLFFVNTKCAYEEPKKMRTAAADARYGKYKEDREYRQLVPEYYKRRRTMEIEGSEFWNTDIQIDGPYYTDTHTPAPSAPNIKNVAVKVREIKEWEQTDLGNYIDQNNYYHKAIATSECFPNADISEVIKAIEDGFGVRFLFSDGYQRVRIVLLRNVFRNMDVQDIVCDIIKRGKTDNPIRGFRMTYGDSNDTAFNYKGFADKLPHKKELWIDDSDKHDYSHWDLNARYIDVISHVTAFDKTCYVTPDTGDAYGIKVDKDAKRYDELHPSLFEFAGYMDAEDGDCTGDDNTIEEISLAFAPAIMNDVNFEQERNATSEEERTKQRFALFVDETMRPRRPDLNDLPSDEQPGVKSYDDPEATYSVNKLYAENSPADGMRGDDGLVKPGEFAIMSDMYATQKGLKAHFSTRISIDGSDYVNVGWDVSMSVAGHIQEGYRLYLQDNYEPNDDGICPIENHDWGLTLGIMRGSGSDARVAYEADHDDGEGNDTWEVVAGSSTTAHPDTCDCFGHIFDYTADGQDDEQDTTGRFSLKLRAEKPNPYYDLTLPDIVTTKEQAGIAMQKLFTTANTNLLDRPKVSNDKLRSKGWEVTGDGYATVYGIIYGVKDSNGNVHEILWTPITETGGVATPTQLRTYISGFAGLAVSEFKDHDTRHLILDIDTSDRMAEILHQLQTVYYAADGESTDAVNIGRLRYLEISNPKLRGRGLSDTFYKEYSKFIREARISNKTVRMELAQLMTIDKTKKVRVGDVTGLVRKMQYSVSKKTGLGNVDMEIMYI